MAENHPPRRVTPDGAGNFSFLWHWIRVQTPHLNPCYPWRDFWFLQVPVADFKLLQLGYNLFVPGSASALSPMLPIKDRTLLISTKKETLQNKWYHDCHLLSAPICSFVFSMEKVSKHLSNGWNSFFPFCRWEESVLGFSPLRFREDLLQTERGTWQIF